MSPRRFVPAGLAVLLLLIALVMPVDAGLLNFPVQEEINVGRKAAERFESSQHMMGGPQLARIQRIGRKVAGATGRTDLPFTFKLVDNDAINAITFPGGYVYVFRGLMECEPDDDELAGVLGHELVHATQSHAFKRLFMLRMLRRAQVKLTGQEQDNAATQVLEVLSGSGLGRQLEYEADRIGVGFSNRAGYDPKGLLRVLEFFDKMEHSKPQLLERLVASHPPARARIQKLQPVVERLER
ncbi:MAG: hypothetical protein FJX76_10825 [Armatimonadetes bacterium]|nr:hypothetical protein [Armatimonadota bacterium]